MTIVEAILAVLREAKRPLSAADIHDVIVKKELYAFKAKQPRSVVLQQIRRHCVGIQNKTSSSTKYFAREDGDQFTALSSPTVEG
jgi:restriction system protein